MIRYCIPYQANTPEANFDKLHPDEIPKGPWMLFYADIYGTFPGNG